MKTKRKLFLSAFILFALLFVQLASPQTARAACSGTVYVDADSTATTPDGCSWANAFSYLQDALAIAESGDQVRVAEGTYYPDQGAGETNNDRNSTFSLVNGVSIYGGYAGYGAPASDLRDPDPATNNTVLSGDIDGVSGSTNNAYHVVTILNVYSVTVLDGFTITAGNANSATNYGGGMFIGSSNSDLGLENIIFENNAGGNGGGVASFDSSPTFNHVVFDTNTATFHGGGYFSQNGNPSLTNVVFHNNTSGAYGGGMYNRDGSPALLDVVFDSNRTLNTAAAGGGMHNSNTNPGVNVVAPTLTNVTFSNNETQKGGGGGMFNYVSNPTLTNVTFSGNSAYVRGGAVLDEGSSTIYNNVTINGNTAPAGTGGAVRNIYADAIPSNPVIKNTILWGNGTEEIVNDAGNTVSIDDSVVQGGCPTLGTCANIITTPPNLGALADNGGFTQTMAIGLDSSALDAGDNATCATEDQRGLARPQGGICDIGAYEYAAVPTVTDRSPAPGSSGIAVDTDVTAAFSEPMNPATITDSTFTLRADGAGGDVPAVVSYANRVATLNPTTDLQASTLYNVTVASSVEDLTGNTMVIDNTWSFTTSGLSGLGDTSVANFNAGTVGDCYVDDTIGDGALRLNISSSTFCVFVSRIFDTGDLVDWTSLTPTETTPSGTSIIIEVRTGNADGYWTTWQDAGLNPFNNFGGQFLQYRATLSTNDSEQTPVLEQVVLSYDAKAYAVLNAPSGTQNNWDHTFSWTGRSTATNYLLEVYQDDETQVLWKWYTAAEVGCTGGTACSISPAQTLGLPNGNYKWRVADYDTTDGYGIRTNFTNFTLNAACYILSPGVDPVGSGSVTASPVQNCTGGYTAGTVVQLTAVPNAGYVFTGWSGAASGTSNPVSVTMDGHKSVSAAFRGVRLLSPQGEQTVWGNTFSWTGHSTATLYLLEVKKSDDSLVLRKWYTPAQAGCDGGTACSISPPELASLANGDYKWHMRDYGAYGYGPLTDYANFMLNAACYTMSTGVVPTGSGTVNVNTAQNCPNGYTAGSVVQLAAVPNAGYVFSDWSGGASGASNPVSVTMDGNKNVTANMRGITLLSPSDTLTSWDNTFSWSGPTQATLYLLEVKKSDDTLVLRKWYTPAQAGCEGGTACSISPPELASLANGDYKWHMRDYGAYGYGPLTDYANFTLNAACYTLTTGVAPTGSGAVNVNTAQNCTDGYTAGSIVQLTAAPNAGYVFSDWSGGASGASNPVSVTMDGNKNVTANMRGITLLSPSGTLTSWDDTFSWNGHPAATYYLLEVKETDDTLVLRKWYTAAQTGCEGGTACSISPPELASLANGDYKWHMRDYGAYGYGPYTDFTNFVLNQ